MEEKGRKKLTKFESFLSPLSQRGKIWELWELNTYLSKVQVPDISKNYNRISAPQKLFCFCLFDVILSSWKYTDSLNRRFHLKDVGFFSTIEKQKEI